MSQVQIKLTGAKAVVAILLVTAFMGYRFFSAMSTIEVAAAEVLKFSLWGEYASRLMAKSRSRPKRQSAGPWRSTTFNFRKSTVGERPATWSCGCASW